MSFHPLPQLRRFTPFPPAADREFWGRIAADPRAAGVLAELAAFAREAKGSPVPPLTAARYMEYRRSGDRVGYEKPYFARRYALEALAVTEAAEHRGEFLDAIAEYLWSILCEYTWVLPAHACQGFVGAVSADPLPPPHLAYVDLFAAETGSYLAAALSLLDAELRAFSPNLVRAVREEIDRRVLRPVECRLDAFGWARGRNNWAPWCCSNLLWTAAVVMTDDDRFTEFARRLGAVIDRYLEYSPADGCCDEGPGYWSLAAGRCALFAEGIRRAGGGDALFAEPKFRAMCDYIGYAWYAGRRFASFADFGVGQEIYPGLIRLMGRRAGSARALLAAHDCEQQNGLHRQAQTALWLTLLELAEAPVAESEFAEVPRDFLHLYPVTQQLHARYGDLYVAMKGGHNGESHNHLDVGQFVFGTGGRLAVADLGTGTYTRETFGPRRYENWVQNSVGHNPPLFDGVGESPGRESHAGSFTVEGTPGDFTALCDLTPAYPAELGLLHCERRLHFDGKRVTVTDAWRAKSPVAWSVRLFHETGSGVRVSCAGGSVSTGVFALDDAALRGLWGEAVGETKITASASSESEVSFTVEVDEQGEIPAVSPGRGGGNTDRYG